MPRCQVTVQAVSSQVSHPLLFSEFYLISTTDLLDIVSHIHTLCYQTNFIPRFLIESYHSLDRFLKQAVTQLSRQLTVILKSF